MAATEGARQKADARVFPNYKGYQLGKRDPVNAMPLDLSAYSHPKLNPPKTYRYLTHIFKKIAGKLFFKKAHPFLRRAISGSDPGSACR